MAIEHYQDLAYMHQAIDAKAKELSALIDQANALLVSARADVTDPAERERQNKAESFRWLSIAKTDFQTGLMALRRAVEQQEWF